jgi:hypothetical protein
MTQTQQKASPEFILIEQRFPGESEWIGRDLVSSRELWRTWSMSEASCCEACKEEYPEAILCATSRPVAEGERL